MNYEDYYETIEQMPLNKWIKCIDGDITHTRRTTKGTEAQDHLAWENLHDEYIREFGLGKLYKKLLDQMKKKAELELDYVITENRFKLTLLEMETEKLKSMIKTANTGVSIDQTLIHLSKWLGYWLRSKEISVKEFFNLSQEYQRLNKQNDGKENK